jgi:hypothetical protein
MNQRVQSRVSAGVPIRHCLHSSQVDRVACELANKHWGGSWRVAHHAPVTGDERLNGADAPDSRPHVDTWSPAHERKEAA